MREDFFTLEPLDLVEDDFLTLELRDLFELDFTLDEDLDFEMLPLLLEEDERFTLEDLLPLFEPELLDTEPDDLFEDPFDLTLTLRLEPLRELLLVTPDDLVDRTLLELLVLLTLPLVRFVKPELPDLLILNEERLDLRSYF